MSWNRATVAAELVTMFTAATGGIKVHEHPPETLNGPCVVIMRPQVVLYSVVAFTIDEATLPVAIVSGVEQEDAIETIKGQCIKAVLADPSLGGVVQSAKPDQERNWRNVTGAGGIQLLYVELVLTIQM